MNNYLQKVKQHDQKVNPLFNFLGVIVDKITDNEVILRLPLRPEFIQGAGVIAGGILATMADEAMAHLVLANLDEGESTATIEMNMRYLRPVKEGEITATAVMVKAGRMILNVEALVTDEKGAPISKAGASFIIIKQKN